MFRRTSSTRFEPDELAQGVQEMKTRYRDVDELRFVDRFDYLAAIRDG